MNIVNFLINLFGAKTLLVFALLFGVSFVVIIILAILSDKGFHISIGSFKMNLFENKNKNMNKISFMYALLEFQENKTKKVLQLENELLRKQMNYTDQKLLELKYILSESYSNLLTQKLNKNDDVKLHKDYKYFQRLLVVLKEEIKNSVFKDAFIQNHFDAITEEYWSKYVNDKCIYVMNFMDTFMDSMYEDGKNVSRKEISDEEKNLTSKIKELIRTIFNTTREFSLENKKETEKLKNETDNEIKSICIQHGIVFSNEIESKLL